MLDELDNLKVKYEFQKILLSDIYYYHLYDIKEKIDNEYETFCSTQSDIDYINNLSKEIKKNGIKQPIVIAPLKKALKKEYSLRYKYYTLSGRHRLFAINNDPYLKCKYKYIYCAVVLDDSFNK